MSTDPAKRAPLLQATVFAPATVANVASGFDLLGFAISGVGDRVTVERTSKPGVRIEVSDPSVPSDPEKNTAGKPLLEMLKRLGGGFGFSVSIEKGIPIGSGLGGSAASAVGSVVAANALLDRPFSREELLEFSLEGEAVASGAKHADNVGPCLFGGFVLSTSRPASRVVSIPYPESLRCVVVTPKFTLETKTARAALKKELSLRTHIDQSANLASLILGTCTGNFELIARGLVDELIEPQRATLIPGFAVVKKAALDAGALGASISGAGPSVFAWIAGPPTDGEATAIAEQVHKAMIAAFQLAGLSASGVISKINPRGAELV